MISWHCYFSYTVCILFPTSSTLNIISYLSKTRQKNLGKQDIGLPVLKEWLLGHYRRKLTLYLHKYTCFYKQDLVWLSSLNVRFYSYRNRMLMRFLSPMTRIWRLPQDGHQPQETCNGYSLVWLWLHLPKPLKGKNNLYVTWLHYILCSALNIWNFIK